MYVGPLFSEDLFVDPMVYLESCRPLIRIAIEDQMPLGKALVLWQSLKVKFSKLDGSETYHYCSHRRLYVFPESNVDVLLTNCFNKMQDSFEQFQERGSGWVVDRIEHLDAHMAPYRPINGGSYKPLPPALKNKRAIINIKNLTDHE
jgi:hypothetical protein